MTVEKDLEKAKEKLENIKNYDAKMFTTELLFWLKDLEFFYNTLVENQTDKDPSKTFYNIKPSSKRPKEGQIAYVNLRRGYPKETYDGHYCYILKDFGNKYIIIPTTSVKNDSDPNEDFEYDIKVRDFINNDETRLHIDEVRSIDLQRIKPDKGIFEVETDRGKIIEKFKNVLFLN